MKLKIHKRNITKWWIRMYNVYRITTGAVLLIDGKYYNINTFEGRIAIVYVEGKSRKIGLRRCRKYRYAAIEKRKTFCNHINLNLKYQHDIRSRDCEFCYMTTRCSMVREGWLGYTKPRVIIKDLMMVSRYFEENSDGRQPT
jgi:hypothetical protein